jgi:hypothetical protein
MILDTILTVLGSAGIGVKGSTLFVGPLPEEPVNAVAVAQYGGADEIRVLASGSPGPPVVERPRVQVTVRNSSQQAAWTKALAVKAALRGYAGGSILNVAVLGDLFAFPEDSRLAYRVTGNFEVWLTP